MVIKDSKLIKNHLLYMRRYGSQAFTFVELLVAVSIIIILSVIVYTSINTSRARTADVAIQQNLDQIRTASVIYRDNHGNYGAIDSNTTGCDSASDFFVYQPVRDSISAVKKLSDNTAVCLLGDTTLQGFIANSWAISVHMKSDSSKSLCVDNRGLSKIGEAVSNTDGSVGCL
jgi:type II secretory pathway pseudopilin PulG